MTEKRYKAIPETAEYKDTVTGEFLSPKFEEDFYKVLDLLNENEELKKTNNKWIVDYNGLNTEYEWLKEEKDELKQQLNDLQTFDDEDFIEIEHINNIYKKLGFQGVIDYAKDNLQQYGAVREVEKGLWVMVTGGWSEHEMWLDCLNSFVSMFGMKHYCAYERGGAFYYTEKPHDKIEIILKGDLE